MRQPHFPLETKRHVRPRSVDNAEAAQALAVGDRRRGAAGLPEVIVHDPAAQRAHDLDDPFFDDKVQTRIGDVIAGAGHKK